MSKIDFENKLRFLGDGVSWWNIDRTLGSFASYGWMDQFPDFCRSIYI
jgi:hypothetical protein